MNLGVKKLHLKLFLPLAIGLLVLVPALFITWFSYSAAQQTAIDAANSVMVQASLRASEAANADLAESSRLMNYFSSYGDAIGGEPNPENFVSADHFEEVAWAAMRSTRLIKFIAYASVDGVYRAINLNDVDALPEVLVLASGETKRQYYRSAYPLDRRMMIGRDKTDYLPSARPWYQSAIKAADKTGSATDQRSWTDTYASFSRNQLQISHSVVVRNPKREIKGVLALEVSFKLLGELLQSLQISPNAIAFIVDRKGNLVASSNAQEITGAAHAPLQAARASRSPLVQAAMENLPQRPLLSAPHKIKIETAAQGKQNLNATCFKSGRCENFQFEWQDKTVLAHTLLLNHLPEDEESLAYPVLSKLARGENFPEWRLVIAVPADDFSDVIKEKSQRTVLLAALLALLASAFGIWFALRLNRVIAAIARAAVKLGHGDLDHQPIRSHFVEFRQIGDELENTADVLRASRDALMAQNAELEERVAERTKDLSYQTEQALLAVNAKAAFLATMSHEIRTPMNGVIGMTELLASTSLNAEQRDYVSTIRTSGDALLTIINDILDFSKIESGKLSLEREPLSVVQLIEESLALVANVANRKNLELLYEIDPAVPAMVMGDITRLRQIILNLLSNAVKFTDAGEVLVRVQQEDPFRPEILCISVSDTGIGIPANGIASLFSAFTQIDAATTRKYGGTGLGLAISRRLAELMHGSIQVESELGRGSRFIVRVKAHPAVANAMGATVAQSMLLPMPEQLATLRGKCALLMDDNLSSLRILQQRLSAYGMDSVCVSSLSALNNLLKQTTNYDCALIDFDMPDVNGISVAQYLRTKTKIPVLLLSNVMESRELDSEAACSMHLFKPIKENGLLDALVRVLTSADQLPRATNDTGVTSALVSRDQVHDFAQTGTAPTYLSQQAKEPSAQRNLLRILVVDDNATNRKVAHMMLQHLGYTAASAVDGRDAVEQVLAADAAQEPFDLIWMDVHMPNLDGLESTKILRSSAIQQPYIVAMTAAAMHGDREMCLQAGMNDYVCKPLEIVGLERALRDYFKDIALTSSVLKLATNELAQQEEQIVDETDQVNAIVYFDPNRFMAFVEGNPTYRATFLVLIKNMLNKSPAQFASAQQAWDEQQNEVAARVFHTMRGSLGTLGAIEFIETSRQLEEAIQQNRTDDVAALFVHAKKVLDFTMAEAQQWLDQQEAQAHSD